MIKFCRSTNVSQVMYFKIGVIAKLLQIKLFK